MIYQKIEEKISGSQMTFRRPVIAVKQLIPFLRSQLIESLVQVNVRDAQLLGAGLDERLLDFDAGIEFRWKVREHQLAIVTITLFF